MFISLYCMSKNILLVSMMALFTCEFTRIPLHNLTDREEVRCITKEKKTIVFHLANRQLFHLINL